jgi:Uma2 family endonuclease
MMLTREYSPLSESEYLRLEAQSPIRHEYVGGEVFAMTGTTLRHNTIALNLATMLRAHLRKSQCRVFMSDVRVHIENHSAYYYPDLAVSCFDSGKPVDLDAASVEDPTLIVEVLSPSTESTDRREKLLAYRTLTSLREYVLVSTDKAHIEIHRRQGDIGWTKIEYSHDETITFASVGMTGDMRAVYEGVSVTASGSD